MFSTPRRVFLQTAVMAIPSATLAVPAFARAEASQAPTRRKTDPVLQELLRQVQDATKAATRSNAGTQGGEALRQLANALRVFAAHGHTLDLDRNIGARLRSHSRSALLTYRPDLLELQARLKAQGVEVDVSQLGQVPDDPAARAGALDAVLAKGATAAFEKVARSFDELAAKLDKQRGLQLIRRQYIDCSAIFWDLFMLEVIMIAACGPWALAVWEPCLIATAAYLTMRATACYVWGCC